MRSNSYHGKRVYCGNQRSSGFFESETLQTILRILFFPVLFLYLEIVLHISMKTHLAYLPVYTVFGMAAGFFFSAITLPFRRRVNAILTKVLAVIFTLVYVIEIIAKKILQSYYPLSTLGTAAGNRLTDYTPVIIEQVISSIPLIILMFLPVILLFVFGNRFLGFERFDIRFAALVLIVSALFHVGGLGVIRLPWTGDLTPKQLYRVDTNIDDQVEQLGLWTMLRLDIKHQIFPPKADLDDDFSDLDSLGGESSSVQDGSSSGDSSTGTSVPVIDTSPNVMDIDLASVAETAKNKDIAWLAEYFNSVTPTNKNEYTGMFEGYNVIQLVLEGFSGYAIDPNLTPTLYKLANEGFVFQNYYTALHFTSTSNGECQSLLGLYPKNGPPITMKRTGELGTNCYFSLAQQLGREGYQVVGYHNNQNMYGRNASHTNLGYDWKYYTKGLTCEENSSGTDRLWPQRDKYMIEVSIDDYINSDKPFHVYYLTVSGHTNYGWNRVANQYKDLVSELPYSEKTQAYVAAAAIEVDRALEYLLQRLEEAGKLDKTLIVATGDHIPYADVDVLEELTGKKFGSSEALTNIDESSIDFDVYKNTLIMWSASMKEPVQVDKVCCQVDILPTVSNLLGLEYDSRMLAGSDILSDSEGLAVFSSSCWKSDKGFYNRFNQTFTPAPGVNMTSEEQDSYVSAMKKLVSYKLACTPLIVEHDFYNYIFGEK